MDSDQESIVDSDEEMNSSDDDEDSHLEEDAVEAEERKQEEARIRELLLTDEQYFKMALNLIPTEFYFDEDTKQMVREQEEKEGQSSKIQGKRQEGEVLSEKALWKRKKFDPTQIRNVTELQAHIIETEHAEKLKLQKKHKKNEHIHSPEQAIQHQQMQEGAFLTSSNNKDSDHRTGKLHKRNSEATSSVESTNAKQKHKQAVRSQSDKSKHKRNRDMVSTEESPKKKPKLMNNLHVDTSHHFSSLSNEEAREKLHKRIEEMQAKRRSLSKSEGREKKKMKRRESKMKLKMRRKTEKLPTPPNSLGNGVKTPQKSPAKKPIYNKEGKMVFSKFDFTDSGSKDKSDALTGKNYKLLLDKVHRQNEKVEKLKETDETKANELSVKTQWKTAIQKAEGVKVKDNPELLMKALKKKDKMKDKKKKGWEDRDAKLKAQLKERQDKRKTNLNKRKQKRIDRKINKQKKKGRIIPGF